MDIFWKRINESFCIFWIVNKLFHLNYSLLTFSYTWIFSCEKNCIVGNQIASFFFEKGGFFLYNLSKLEFETSYWFITMSVIDCTLNSSHLAHIVWILFISSGDCCRALVNEEKIFDFSTTCHSDIKIWVDWWNRHNYHFLSNHWV